jgi:hypothetical protein
MPSLRAMLDGAGMRTGVHNHPHSWVVALQERNVGWLARWARKTGLSDYAIRPFLGVGPARLAGWLAGLRLPGGAGEPVAGDAPPLDEVMRDVPGPGVPAVALPGWAAVRLDALGLVPVYVPRDGDCMFNALIMAAGERLGGSLGAEPTPGLLRGLIADALQADLVRAQAGQPTRFGDFIGERSGHDRSQVWEGYIRSIREAREWGNDGADLALVVAADAFGLPLTVLRRGEGSGSYDYGPAGGGRHVLVHDVGTGHYWAARPAAQPARQPAQATPQPGWREALATRWGKEDAAAAEAAAAAWKDQMLEWLLERTTPGNEDESPDPLRMLQDAGITTHGFNGRVLPWASSLLREDLLPWLVAQLRERFQGDAATSVRALARYLRVSEPLARGWKRKLPAPGDVAPDPWRQDEVEGAWRDAVQRWRPGRGPMPSLRAMLDGAGMPTGMPNRPHSWVKALQERNVGWLAQTARETGLRAHEVRSLLGVGRGKVVAGWRAKLPGLPGGAGEPVAGDAPGPDEVMRDAPAPDEVMQDAPAPDEVMQDAGVPAVAVPGWAAARLAGPGLAPAFVADDGDGIYNALILVARERLGRALGAEPTPGRLRGVITGALLADRNREQAGQRARYGDIIGWWPGQARPQAWEELIRLVRAAGEPGGDAAGLALGIAADAFRLPLTIIRRSGPPQHLGPDGDHRHVLAHDPDNGRYWAAIPLPRPAAGGLPEGTPLLQQARAVARQWERQVTGGGTETLAARLWRELGMSLTAAPGHDIPDSAQALLAEEDRWLQGQSGGRLTAATRASMLGVPEDVVILLDHEEAARARAAAPHGPQQG